MEEGFKTAMAASAIIPRIISPFSYTNDPPPKKLPVQPNNMDRKGLR
jgi:hypothetical protein